MVEMRNVRTVGELKELLKSYEDHQPIGLSYHQDEGIGETLVVMADDSHQKDVGWVGLEVFDTSDLTDDENT